MRVMYAIAAWTAITGATAAPQPNELQVPWLKSLIVARGPDVAVRPVADRERTERDVMSPGGALVLDVEGDELLVEFGWLRFTERGWVKKADVVTVESADGVMSRMLEKEPQNVWAHLARGTARELRHIQGGDKALLDAAIDDFDQAVGLAPDDPLPLLLRAEAMVVARRADDAQRDLDAAEKLSPDDPSVSLLRAKVFFLVLNDLDKAREHCDRTLKLAPKNSDAFALRGILARKQQKWAESVADFSEAIRLTPERSMLYVNRALSQRERGDAVAALEDYTKALEFEETTVDVLLERASVYFQLRRLDEAEQDCDLALRADPNLPRAWVSRALVNWLRQRHAEALVDIDKALKIDRKFFSAWMARGDIHRDLGQLAEAVNDYSRAIEASPQHPDGYHERAVVRGALGKIDLALSDLKRCCQLDPTLIPPRVTRAELLVTQGRAERAIEELGQAIGVVRDPRLLITRSRAYAALKDYDKAKEDIDEVIQLDPKSAIAYGLRGALHMETDRNELALADLDQSIKLGPTPQVYLARANLHAELGRSKDALRDASMAMLSPQYAAAARALRGRLLGQQGKVRQSLNELREAVKLAPSSAEAHAQLAAALSENGNPEEALNEASLAVRLDPLSPMAYGVRGRIWAARAEHRRARDDFDELVRLTEGPAKADALLLRAHVLGQLGDPAAALRDADEAVALSRTAETLRQHGGVASAANDMPRCLADYEEALRLEPKNTRVYGDRVMIYVILARWDEALADAEQVVQLGEKAEGHRLKAYIYKFRQDAPNTLAEATEALKHDPGLAEAFYLRSAANWLLGRNGEALQDAEAAIRLTPEHAPSHRAKAMALERLGQLNEALAAIDEALRLQPNYDWAYDTRARIHYRRQDLAAALRDADAALRLNSRIRDSYLVKCQALLAQGNAQGAFEASQSAFALFPQDLLVLLARGEVYLQTRNLNLALSDAQEAVRLSPSAPEGHLLLARVLLDSDRPAEALSALSASLERGCRDVGLAHFLQGDATSNWTRTLKRPRASRRRAKPIPTSRAR